jgi:hypothetical protein
MKFNDYWNLPKNVKNYFSPKQEKYLKEKYGKLYTFHTILSIVIVLMPFIIYLCIAPSNAFNPTTQSGNILGAIGGILGLIGSVSIGVGIVNCFMALIKQYLGHWVTLIAIIGGVILDILGIFVFTLVK